MRPWLTIGVAIAATLAATTAHAAGSPDLRASTAAHDGSMPLTAAPLTEVPGDPAVGRRIVEDRAVAACTLCHAGPFANPHLLGSIGPSLEDVGQRLTAAEIRIRLIDSRLINRETVMPPYHVTTGLHRVGPAWAGKPVLSAQQIEDVVAFLVTLRTP